MTPEPTFSPAEVRHIANWALGRTPRLTPLRMSADTTGASWITVGGKEKDGKKHVGGFAVKIDSEGRIILGGPKGLKGKKVSDVHKFFRRSRGQKKAAKATRDIYQRQAAEWGVSEQEYRELADEVFEAQAQHFRAREKAKQEARRRLGVTAGDIKRWEEQGFDVASKHGASFDTLGRELARAYPDLGWGGGFETERGDEGYDEKLWELLSEGKRDLPPRHSEEFHDAVNAFLSTMEAQYGEGTAKRVDPEPEDWEAVPFALRPPRAAEADRIAAWALGREPRP